MSTHNLKPMSEVVKELKDQGYTIDFLYKDDKLYTSDKKKSYEAGEITIQDEYRFEGDSDPADMAILYAIETVSGDKGTIVDSYGSDSSVELEDFLGKAHHSDNR